MTEMTVPQVRFEGFDGSWDQRKFVDIAHRKTRMLIDSGLPQVEYEDIDSGRGTLNKDLGEKKAQKTGVEFQPGDVLFGKLRPYLKNWLLADFRGVAVGDFWVLKGNDCASGFLYNLIQGPKFTSISNISSGSKMPRSDWELVAQSRFATPKSLYEQQQIGVLFFELDALIGQHWRKHAKLQQAKVALMQRMFPRSDVDKPELRFEGFSGVWERRRLDEFDIKTGPFGSSLHASDYVLDGTPIVTTEHFKTGRLPDEGSGVPQVSNADALRLAAYRLQEGDIVFSRVGSVDLNAYVTRNQLGWLFSGRVLRVRPDRSCHSVYLHYALETEPVRQSILSRAVGLTMPSINTRILGDTTVLIPSSAVEQQVIGAMFSRLDDLIAFERTYIGKLQQAKTSLLQKMFV